MKLTIESISPSAHYDGRAINYLVQVITQSGQQLKCFDPSGAVSYLRSGYCVDGLLTALNYTLVTEQYGDNCITGIIRNSLPINCNTSYQELFKNHFVGLETIDGIIFLYHNQKNEMNLSLYNDQIVNVRITGGLYLELQLSEQYVV